MKTERLWGKRYEAPVEAEIAPIELAETVEAPVEAAAAAVETPEVLEVPIAAEVPTSLLEPAPEWSSEVTPPAGIKREALEEPVLEPAPIEPAPAEIVEPEPTLAEETPEPVQMEVTPPLAEVAEQPAELSLEAFQALSKANQETLMNARNAVDQGQPVQAAEAYRGLIKQNYHLDEIIKDLQDALYRFPVDIDMWVTLGDAYLHTDDLSEALNAYTKAEELVR